MTSAIALAMEPGKDDIAGNRAWLAGLKGAKPIVSIYMNNPNGSAGLVFCGRINVRDMPRYQFPTRNNVSSQGYMSIRASHYMAKFIASLPNDPDLLANYVVRVDMYGGELRWTGLGHHWKAETKDGADVITFFANDDMQMLQFLLAPPNPILPVNVFQFPRVWPEFGPTCWCVSALGWLNEARNELGAAIANLVIPTDIFDFTQWTNEMIAELNPENWQTHWICPSFVEDSSLWTILASRMNTVDSVVADSLDDAQVTIVYRRYFTDEGELPPDGLLVPNIANGALVFQCVDRSGFSASSGTFFGGSAVGGFTRSVIQWTDGFVEDTYTTVADSEALYPDEYWQTDFLGTLAAAPGLCLRDSHFNDLQGAVTYSESTASTVIVGGDNPAADATAKLIIESVGDLVGYFLLGGFDSLGEMASDVIMPFLVGTIFAWDTWTNTGRVAALGWVRLWEVFQTGADNNSWSLSALAAFRGGFDATKSETSHTMVIGQAQWPIPGLNFSIGDRIGSTSGVLQRMGIDLIFVDQVEEMILDGQQDGAFQFNCKVGQNKAAMTTGEREARLMKKALDTLSNIGVHIIS